MSQGPPEGYVDVAARIRAFYDKFPEGRLRRQGDPKVVEIGGKNFVQYTALAYRDGEDKLPGMGTAWEPFPGPTPFTKDSELMNAETAAWGRAIASLGFEVHEGIATAEDVRNRSGVQPQPKRLSDKQVKLIVDLARQLGADANDQELIRAYCLENLTAGREGSGSKAIAALKGEGETEPADVLVRLVSSAAAWASKESDLPADETDLPAAA